MRIQLGAHVGMQNIEMEALRTLWRLLDEKLDWISVWDHLYEVPPSGGSKPHYEALTGLATLCADTCRARIGVLVLCVGYRNPAYLAKAATTLDHISSGRFEMGLGAGWAEEEALAFGYDFPSLDTRMRMLEEAIPAVKALLQGERVTHHGEFFRVNDAAIVPVPVRGHIPIWIGGKGRNRTPRIAAAHADGWNAPLASPEEYLTLSAGIDRACEAIGRDPASIERSVNLGFYMSSGDRSPEDLEGAARFDLGPDRMGAALIGSTEQVVERIMEYVALGVHGINVGLRPPIDDAAIANYLEEVVPAVRAAVS